MPYDQPCPSASKTALLSKIPALSRQISIGNFRRRIRPSALVIREQKQWSSSPPWCASRQYRIYSDNVGSAGRWRRTGRLPRPSGRKNQPGIALRAMRADQGAQFLQTMDQVVERLKFPAEAKGRLKASCPLCELIRDSAAATKTIKVQPRQPSRRHQILPRGGGGRDGSIKATFRSRARDLGTLDDLGTPFDKPTFREATMGDMRPG
jgi:hypothetical protein